MNCAENSVKYHAFCMLIVIVVAVIQQEMYLGSGECLKHIYYAVSKSNHRFYYMLETIQLTSKMLNKHTNWVSEWVSELEPSEIKKSLDLWLQDE